MSVAWFQYIEGNLRLLVSVLNHPRHEIQVIPSSWGNQWSGEPELAVLQQYKFRHGISLFLLLLTHFEHITYQSHFKEVITFAHPSSMVIWSWKLESESIHLSPEADHNQINELLVEVSWKVFYSIFCWIACLKDLLPTNLCYLLFTKHESLQVLPQICYLVPPHCSRFNLTSSYLKRLPFYLICWNEC